MSETIPVADSAPRFRPYLEKGARFSQIWLNRWNVLLLLVLVRCLLAVDEIGDQLEAGRNEALRACTEVESVGSTLASMPHYMAAGINELTAHGLEKAVGGLATILQLSATAVEQIVLFVVHMMTSTYLCLITLTVHGSVRAVAESSIKASESLQKAIDDATKSLGDKSKSLSESLSEMIDKINRIPLVDDQTLPKIDFTDQMEKLKSFEIPADVQNGLVKLNETMPTFEDVQNYIDNIIKTPFEAVQTHIRNMTSFRLERRLLPIPPVKRLDFCKKGNAISDFFQGLADKVSTARKVFLGAIVALAAGLCSLVVLADHRCTIKTDMARAELRKTTIPENEKLILLQAQPSKLWFLGQRLNMSSKPSHKSAASWLIAYATSPCMLFVLTIGAAGLLSCFCQYWLLRIVQSGVPRLTRQVADFAGEVIQSLAASSASWSRDVNAAVRALDEQVNRDVFSIVNATTTAINSTIDGFVEKMSRALEDTFGSTILHDPIEDVLHCLVGLKVASFQRALAWAQQNAHVSFPEIRNDSFTASALAQLDGSHSAAELLANANGAAEDKVSAALQGVMGRLASRLRAETIMFSVLVGLWLLSAVGGAIYVGVALTARQQPPPLYEKTKVVKR